MIGEQGEGLIFILSQPRAGSTLLQRILGAHQAVHTSQEPAIALHPLYALREGGYEAEYGAAGTRLFTQAFLAQLPEGEEAMVAALRQMLGYLYGRALSGSNKRYFVDKTPRYFFIIPELYRVFPAAAYVLLWRNPLAVLNSILSTWVRGEWLGVAHARPDLLDAPRLLLDGRTLLGERAVEVHYEALVREPDKVLPLVCRHLGLAYEPAMVEYGDSSLPRWQYADQKNVYAHARPEPDHAEEWVNALAEPQVWRISHDYLQWLGPETVSRMGYSYDELEQVLMARAPSRLARYGTFSLGWLARRPPAERALWERRLVWLVRRLGGMGRGPRKFTGRRT